MMVMVMMITIARMRPVVAHVSIVTFVRLFRFTSGYDTGRCQAVNLRTNLSIKSSLTEMMAFLHSCKNMIYRHLLTLTDILFSTSYYSKYGPVEGANDRKSVSEFLKQSIVMCSSCR